MHNAFVGYENIVPILAPQDITNAETACSFVNVKNAQRLAFMVFFGALTTATATDTVVVTVECATADGAAEEAIPFNYRLSGALGTNTWGAVTTAASGGATIASTDDNTILWIEVDLSTVTAENEDAYLVRPFLSTPADMAATLVSAVAIIEPRYKQTTYISATASASA